MRKILNEQELLAGVFKRRINHQQFNIYCDKYELNVEKTKEAFTKRGYVVVGDRRMSNRLSQNEKIEAI